jgi:hypothetical protein
MPARSTRPDLTPAQIVGVVVAGVPILANLAQAFGVWTATPAELDALQQAGQFAIAAAGTLFVGDAAIRVGRNVAQARVDAAVHNAEGHREAAAAAATIAAASTSTPLPLERIAPAAGDVEAPGAGVVAVPGEELVDDETELAAPPPADEHPDDGAVTASVAPDVPDGEELEA